MGAYGETDYANGAALQLCDPHLGVIAGPSGVESASAGRSQISHNVAVRVEETHFGDASSGRPFWRLASRSRFSG